VAGALALVLLLAVGLATFIRSRPKPTPIDRNDACRLLDKKVLSKVTDRKVHSLVADAGPLGKRICVASFVGTEVLKLYIARDGGKETFESAAGVSQPENRTDIAGVGDEAKWIRSSQAMVIRSGLDTFTLITLNMSGTEAEHQSIARALAPKVIEGLRKTPPPPTSSTTKKA
jgi:hypothetical protein